MTLEIVPALLIALVPYVVVHVVLVTLLLRIRRRLPSAHRNVSRGLLVATALPLVGPVVSSFAFGRLARCLQQASAVVPGFRSDCGHAAGVAYGLLSLVAAWVREPVLGGLTLVALLMFFWQVRTALGVLRSGGKGGEASPAGALAAGGSRAAC